MESSVANRGIMAPEPTIMPRKPVPARTPVQKGIRPVMKLTSAHLCVAIVCVLAAGLPWARRWLMSGCAVESLVIIYGDGSANPRASSIPLWTALATLNVIYAVASTSWLIHGIFTALCWPAVVITCLFKFDSAAKVVRRSLRKVLRQLHFTRDKIALFNLPALQIDTDVDGLFVIRGVTISLSSFTVEVHGIELGIRIMKDIELAMYVDQVTIALFRRIEIGDVYGNLKGGKTEMSFGNVGQESPENKEPEDDFIIGNSALLRAATDNSESFRVRPKLRQSLTGADHIKDSTARAGLRSVRTLHPDDDKAEEQYNDILADIRTTSAVYQSRQQVKQSSKSENGFNVETEKDMRAAICAELHVLPTIVHPPERSIRVTTLQKLQSARMRNLMHRMPFFLRLLLNPLTQLHPIKISSINVAGSGKWLIAILHEHVFKHYGEDNAEIRRLNRRISEWLADSNFCAELTNINGLSQVPLTTAFDIVAYLNFKEMMAYRTVPETGSISQVIGLAGADATVTIPSYLLPHHEHMIPAPPEPETEEQLNTEVDEADGLPKTVQKEQERKKVLKDEATITLSVHGTLPVTADQSLLNFIAALVKATKIIELEKDMEDGLPPLNGDEARSPSVFALENDSSDSIPGSPTKDANGFKNFARNVRQNFKDGTAGTTIKEYSKDLNQKVLDNMKKAAVGVAINDQWIARMVGKIAAKLERAQGDIGYSGGIPVALGPYRGTPDMPTKLLP